MGMSDLYGPADDRESIATIHAALDAGITLLDTGDYYGMGQNEMLIGRAMEGRNRDKVHLSVKFGAMRDPRGNWIGVDGRPSSVKNFLAYSLRRLRTDYVDIYRLGRTDPKVPVEDTVGALAELVQAGYVRHIGLSEAGVETLRRAAGVHAISDLQIEYSLLSRGSSKAFCLHVASWELASPPMVFSPADSLAGTGRGIERFHRMISECTHHDSPRPTSTTTSGLWSSFATWPRRRNATVAQVAIAWVLSQQDSYIVPLVGARRRERLTEALGALKFHLAHDDIREIERVIPSGSAAGDRYPPPVLAGLDSEKK